MLILLVAIVLCTLGAYMCLMRASHCHAYNKTARMVRVSEAWGRAKCIPISHNGALPNPGVIATE
jgi:hypothetical protein